MEDDDEGNSGDTPLEGVALQSIPGSLHSFPRSLPPPLLPSPSPGVGASGTPTIRHLRMNTQVHNALIKILEGREWLRLNLATHNGRSIDIVGVDLNRDMSATRAVWSLPYTVSGAERPKVREAFERELAGGGKARKVLQRMLNARVRMKYATVLTFKYNLQEVPGRGEEIDWKEIDDEIEKLS